MGDWFSKMFPKGGGDFVPGREFNPMIDVAEPFSFRYGGKVPKYYGGGNVQGGSSPTIAGYFSEQGKTLGGSNKQSLAEMLGRR